MKNFLFSNILKIVIVLVVAFMHFGLLAWLSIGPGGTIDPCVTTPSGLGKGPDTQACIEHKKQKQLSL